MKKQNLIQLLFCCFFLFSCQSKPEIKQGESSYTIHNYKLDDDELARRKTQDSIDSVKDTLASKK